MASKCVKLDLIWKKNKIGRHVENWRKEVNKAKWKTIRGHEWHTKKMAYRMQEKAVGRESGLPWVSINI